MAVPTSIADTEEYIQIHVKLLANALLTLVWMVNPIVSTNLLCQLENARLHVKLTEEFGTQQAQQLPATWEQIGKATTLVTTQTLLDFLMLMECEELDTAVLTLIVDGQE